jgi:D-amino-acid dehydrogenase
MEITGTDLSINPKRVQGIFESIQSYYPHFKAMAPNQELVWSGLRPCSPDGLPYIGKVAHLENLLIGTGHSMMGLSLAPATGHLLADLLSGKGSSIAIDAFDPQRFA